MTSWGESDRRHLADLIREDDRLRAERAALVKESEAPALLYREHENREPAPAPAPEAEPSGADDDPWYAAIDEFTESVTNWSERVKDDLRALKAENQYLHGKVDALLIMIGQRASTVENPEPTKPAEVIDLPDWRKGDVA